MLALLRTVALMYHKPCGLLVTHADEFGRPTVYEQLAMHAAMPPALRDVEWHAVGPTLAACSSSPTTDGSCST